jgi:hypothetical protein
VPSDKVGELQQKLERDLVSHGQTASLLTGFAMTLLTCCTTGLPRLVIQQRLLLWALSVGLGLCLACCMVL